MYLIKCKPHNEQSIWSCIREEKKEVFLNFYEHATIKLLLKLKKISLPSKLMIKCDCASELICIIFYVKEVNISASA